MVRVDFIQNTRHGVVSSFEDAHSRTGKHFMEDEQSSSSE